MRPSIPYSTPARLKEIAPVIAFDGMGLPVAVEWLGGGHVPTSLMSHWRPSWRELLRIAFGACVRVSINYSPGGPLFVDVARDARSLEGVSPGDIKVLIAAEAPSLPHDSAGG